MKRLNLTKKEICTIPNLLTLIRILCIPVVITMVILGGLENSHPQWYVYIGLGLMAFAAATDVVDGWIARKFNQGSYVGQLVDPIADKVMHIGAVLSLVIIGYLHWAFLVLLVIRELSMVIAGSFIFNKVNIKSNMLGKVASAILSIGIIFSFFHNFTREWWGEYSIDWIIVTLGIVLNWSAAINYAVWAAKAVKKNKAKEEEEKKQLAESTTENVTEQSAEQTTEQTTEQSAESTEQIKVIAPENIAEQTQKNISKTSTQPKKQGKKTTQKKKGQ